MTDTEAFPLKNMSLWFVIACCGMVTAYLVFIGIISVWVGFHHFDQDGFWIPIMGGMIVIFLLLGFFFRLTRYISAKIKGKENTNVLS